MGRTFLHYESQVTVLILIIIFLTLMPLHVFATESVMVRYEDVSFNVSAHLSNGNIKSITVDEDFSSILIDVETGNQDAGELVISLPRALIDAKNESADDKFIVVAGNNEVDYEETTNSESERELMIAVPPGTTRIEIVGTQVVPEFPLPVAGVMVAIIGITIILARLHKNEMRT
jgi:hypothetical protein